MSTPSTIGTLTLPSDRPRRALDFNAISLRLASPEEILKWSHGEVTKPETINYRSRKPERDGLFCQKIFGPVKDWQCACGKYKKLRYRGIVCDRCGVEITRSLVRRERMGHIQLAAPVTHIWFLRSVPSRIGLALDMSVQILEKIVYFANFVITDIKEDLKQQILEELEQEFKQKKKELKNGEDAEKKIQQLTQDYNETKREILDLRLKKLLTELEYRDFSLKYGHIFSADIGAEAILKLLQDIELLKLVKEIEKEKRKTTNPTKKKKLVQRIECLRSFLVNKIQPEHMILKIIPVVPPELRPLVPLDGGRFASSDLNDLYRRVINRNNRLKRLYDLHAPEVILRNEKRMLQEAVDALIDNNMRSGKTTIASTGQRRPLKSLADILKGKQGRFRQNLLGKRVDYSGRSVIVVGPKLKLNQCGLPKIMALELFKPFIASQLIKGGLVHNVRSANRLIEDGTEDVWAILEEITKKSYVLLNRAPTLHRLGIQAFQPVLIEGKAIQIHPLVCAAFNADFDGDQMAVHVPITERAQKEAKDIILSTHNLLKPATGEPVVTPTQDIVWGAYYMTMLKDKKKNLSSFINAEEALLAYQLGKIDLQEKINVRVDKKMKETSAGRLAFNNILPPGLYQMNDVVDKKRLKDFIIESIEIYGQEKTVEMLDKIKEITLSYLTASGLSWGMDDLPNLPEKPKIIQEAEKNIDKIQSQYEMGLLAEDERYLKSIETWMTAKSKITEIVKKNPLAVSAIFTMVESGARGSWTQLAQMFGMRGIVSSPTGRLIELPIKSSFKEGFDVLEYFISTHGSRKGVADTALRTASAGYLTRRMVDVCQDIIITEKDCGDKKGICLTRQENLEMDEDWQSRLFGRTAVQAIEHPKTKKVIVKANEMISRQKAKEVNEADPEKVFIRSVLSCKSLQGTCIKCYGYDLGYNKPVELGVPVGVIAAQSIGEPGTQLTLRTFHTGGVAGADITQGLPRVEELFEVRPVKKKAVMVNHDGVVNLVQEDDKKGIIIKYKGEKQETYLIDEDEDWKIKVKQDQEVKRGEVLAAFSAKGGSASGGKKRKITAKHKGKIKLSTGTIKVFYERDDKEEYDVTGYNIWVKDGDKVKVGEQLTDGSLDLRELYELQGREATEKYILKETQYIYSSQAQKLNDKHVEIVIRQMFSRCLINDGGETNLLPGEIVPKSYFWEINKKAKALGKKQAEAEERLTGITRVSLSTDSWLSAASFQETSRVLVKAAISGRPDHLRGLKENVIVGRLIPVGTGLAAASQRKS
ncbi:DNA-directed RNA polymerase subunit beta' [Patescibacteria group bacterium]|nr:DNA-directed RNA polymerase subunit beta' [Patescibacteria group bacterium]